jgi:hypothetical protein
MFNSDFVRVALAGLGALIFSAATVGAAVVPARLVETTPLVYADAAPLVQGAEHA